MPQSQESQRCWLGNKLVGMGRTEVKEGRKSEPWGADWRIREGCREGELKLIAWGGEMGGLTELYIVCKNEGKCIQKKTDIEKSHTFGTSLPYLNLPMWLVAMWCTRVNAKDHFQKTIFKKPNDHILTGLVTANQLWDSSLLWKALFI